MESEYCLGNQKLKVVNEERDLGLIISNTLKSGVQKLLNQSIPH